MHNSTYFEFSRPQYQLFHTNYSNLEHQYLLQSLKRIWHSYVLFFRIKVLEVRPYSEAPSEGHVSQADLQLGGHSRQPGRSSAVHKRVHVLLQGWKLLQVQRPSFCGELNCNVHELHLLLLKVIIVFLREYILTGKLVPNKVRSLQQSNENHVTELIKGNFKR